MKMKRVLRPIAVAILLLWGGIAVGGSTAACAQSILNSDLSGYPCHDPQAHFCSKASGGGCCLEGDICGHDPQDDPMNSYPAGTCADGQPLTPTDQWGLTGAAPRHTKPRLQD